MIATNPTNAAFTHRRSESFLNAAYDQYAPSPSPASKELSIVSNAGEVVDTGSNINCSNDCRDLSETAVQYSDMNAMDDGMDEGGSMVDIFINSDIHSIFPDICSIFPAFLYPILLLLPHLVTDFLYLAPEPKSTHGSLLGGITRDSFFSI